MRLPRISVAGLCLLGLCASPAFAQQTTSAGVLFGADTNRVGPGSATLEVNWQPGLLAGGYVRLPLSKRTYSLVIEADYVQKHSQTKQGGTTSQLKLDYLEIPAAVRLPLFKGIYLVEGAAIGIPLRAKAESGSTSTDVKSQVTNPDVSMVMSAGHHVHKNWNLELRYDSSFRRVSKDAFPIERSRSLAIVLRGQLK